MRRREVIAGLLGGMTVLPSSAQPAEPVVGYLYTGTRSLNVGLPGFPRGLGETGFVEGKNVAIERRFADGRNDRLHAMAAELVGRGVDAIFAGDNAAAIAAKEATSTIPVVFWVGGDPVKMGLVESLSRPGGNVTGVSGLTIALVAKKIQLLHDMAPALRSMGLLVNPANPGTPADSAEAAEAAQLRGLQVTTRISQVIELARRHDLPVIYYLRSHVEAGGLMSYAPSIVDLYRAAGLYVGRILKGEKPGDLPVQLAAKLELVINRRTADALKLSIPPALLAQADEVIE
ncbi:MAG TPA: ABC transporter substrate-binding protein [Beijerinckiaceae bacterium]|jgi:putative ABC transport system substrate-binding protein